MRIGQFEGFHLLYRRVIPPSDHHCTVADFWSQLVRVGFDLFMLIRRVGFCRRVCRFEAIPRFM
jgi:hypothetical protein